MASDDDRDRFRSNDYSDFNRDDYVRADAARRTISGQTTGFARIAGQSQNLWNPPKRRLFSTFCGPPGAEQKIWRAQRVDDPPR